MKSTLALFIFLFLSSSLFGQSTLNDMETVNSSFSITSNNFLLDVSKQIMIKRPFANYKVSSAENESYGFAYAFTSWHLEFVSKSAIATYPLPSP